MNPNPTNTFVFIDKECPFCRRWSYRICSWLGVENQVTIIPIDYRQESSKEALCMQKLNSWVVRKDIILYTEYAAFTQLVFISRYAWTKPLLSNRISMGIGTFLYRFIAQKRGSCDHS